MDLRVLQISANWGYGGPGGVEKDIYYCLIEKGHECYVAYGRDSIPDSIPSIKIGNRLNCYLHAFLSLLFDNVGFSSIIATKVFIKKIKKLNPDIIQLHNLIGYYLNIKILFKFLKRYGKPVVWTIHDCWPVTGHCINFDRISCDKWKNGCFNCELKKNYPKSYFLDCSKKNWINKKNIFSDVPNMEIISPSMWLKKILSQSYLSSYPIHVIHNGIDLDIFAPSYSNIKNEYDIDNKTVLLAVAGVWNEMKGEFLLYDIARKLDDKYVLVMIGKKTKPIYLPNLINIERTNDLKMLVKWYTAADVFINPTLGDNFPTVNIEALACGLPIVTNLTGGSAEIINDRCGRIVKSRTCDEFLEKIDECVSANLSSEDCIIEARKYDKRKCFSSYISIYEHLFEKIINDKENNENAK